MGDGDPNPDDRLDRIAGRFRRATADLPRPANGLGDAAFRVVFGDGVGLALFLGALCFAFATWRVDGFLINDNYALANALANLADGHLRVEYLRFGLPLKEQPGLYVSDGAVYARNYGHVVASLPVLRALEAAEAVVDLRIAAGETWALLLLGFFVQVGRLTGRREAFAVAGSTLAFVVFFANAAVATPLSSFWLPLLALQATTALAAAATAVVLYRLLARLYDRRVGVTAGAGVVLATPVGFWATVPKRHVVTAFLAACVLLAFHASRTATAPRRATAARAASYAFVGLAAWVHGLEGFAMFLVLAPVDLATGGLDRRRLGLVALVFAASLLPFFVTNAAVTGDPLAPPRTADSYVGQVPLPAESDLEPPGSDDGPGAGTGENGTGAGRGTGEAPGGGDPTGGDRGTPDGTGGDAGAGEAAGGSGLPLVEDVSGAVLAVAGAVQSIPGGVSFAADRMATFVDDGIRVATEQPARAYHVFVRSGRIPSVDYAVHDHEAVDQAVLESTPVFGALLAAPVLLVATIVSRFSFRRSDREDNSRSDREDRSHADREAGSSAGREDDSTPARDAGAFTVRAGVRSVRRAAASLNAPARATDCLATGIALVFVLAYLPRLPLKTQVTVRYLVPTYPLLLYGVVRLPAVSAVLRSSPRRLAGAYAAFVLVGGAALHAVLAGLSPAVGEAVQFHALVGLATAGVLAAWAVAATLDDRVRAGGAVPLAAAAAATTLFTLFARLEYFPYGSPLSDAAALLADLVSIL